MNDAYIEELFDALTGAACGSYADIAYEAGWPQSRVGRVLAEIRRPDTAAEWGWTVPHVPRGAGEHLFQVVLCDEPQTFTADEIIHTQQGAHSTLAHIATMGENEAFALNQFALHVPSMRRQLRRIATVLAGAAAMAEEARDKIADELNGP